MALLDDFRRVSRANPCPVCERPDWCLIERQPTALAAPRVVCQRIESQIRWGEAGYLHVLGPPGSARAPRVRRPLSIRGSDSEQMTRWLDGCTTSDRRVRILARSLGVTTHSLQRLGLGWADDRHIEDVGTVCCGEGCWTFPMRNERGSVIGVRLRTIDGFKYAVTGSHQGLFIPDDLDSTADLYVAEGPTDVAALLDLGFSAIGRASCGSGRDLLRRYCRVRPVERLVIVGDNDDAGRDGACRLRDSLRAYAPRAVTVTPPPGSKDVREWLGRGATAHDLQQLVAAACERGGP